MVFMAERNLEPTSNDIQKDNLGPGEYSPFSFQKKYSLNKQPFLTSSPRAKFEIKDTPGPGAYYHDETHIKYLKNLQNEQIGIHNDKINLLTKGGQDNLLKICFLMNSEKKGFNIKSKRFKIVDSSSNPPGPGQYFQEKIVDKKEKNKIKKFKDNEIFLKKKLDYIKSSEFQKVPAIPSKDNTFGFDILKNGKLVQIHNPELYRTFTGEKGDTVGPGSYEIEKPKDWLKTGTTWSKFKSVRDCNKNININDFSSSFTTTNYSETKKKNSFNLISSASKINKSDCSILNKFDLSNQTNNNIKCSINNKSNNNKKKNKKTILNLLVSNCKINNSKKPKIIKTFENVIKKVTPGPGYYYNQKEDTSFKIKYVPECKQFFGSKLARFSIKNNYKNLLGPGEYFKEDKNKINNMNKTSLSNIAPFSSSVDRFLVSEEKMNNPGPGEYDNLNKENINKISLSDNKFGSNEIRFNNMYNLKWKNEIPGPGFYHPKIDNINRNYFNFSKTNKNFNKKGQLYSTTKNDLDRYDYIKGNSISNEIKEDIPPIGIYNPEIINSIDYKIRKRAYETRNKNVAFSSTFNNKKKRKKNIIIDCQNSNIGPGYYYHEKKRQDNKLSPVFHLPEFKRNNSSINIMNGPGEYNLDSYNNWNKKSFNINFV